MIQIHVSLQRTTQLFVSNAFTSAENNFYFYIFPLFLLVQCLSLFVNNFPFSVLTLKFEQQGSIVHSSFHSIQIHCCLLLYCSTITIINLLWLKILTLFNSFSLSFTILPSISSNVMLSYPQLHCIASPFITIETDDKMSLWQQGRSFRDGVAFLLPAEKKCGCNLSRQDCRHRHLGS